MPCQICNGTGLIPFVKNDKVIPYAFQDCDCKSLESVSYRPLQPEDIDYPVSRDFYRFYASRNHWPDPGRMEEDRPQKEKELQIISESVRNIPRPSPRPSPIPVAAPTKTTKGGVNL